VLESAKSVDGVNAYRTTLCAASATLGGMWLCCCTAPLHGVAVVCDVMLGMQCCCCWKDAAADAAWECLRLVLCGILLLHVYQSVGLCNYWSNRWRRRIDRRR
jgi:hypothetical protein